MLLFPLVDSKHVEPLIEVFNRFTQNDLYWLVRVVTCRFHVERFGALYFAVQREETELVDPVSKIAVIANSIDHVLHCTFEIFVCCDSGLKPFSNVRVT